LRRFSANVTNFWVDPRPSDSLHALRDSGRMISG